MSRRLGLIQALPQRIHEQVREGVLPAHAAMKYLLPLARANAQAVTELAAAITALKLTSRQIGALYAGWKGGTARTRELILSRPQLYLQAQSTHAAAVPSATQRWLNDLGAISGIARRAHRTLQGGLLQQLLAAERTEVERSFARMRADLQQLFERFDLESGHAG